MAFRTTVLTWSKGDLMETYWKVFFKRQNETSGWKIDLMTIFLNRRAHAHGGYIGKDTYFAGRPRLPHGLHGIFISRYAHIGKECWIYQNVTIGEVNSKAPTIGNNVLIGAGACLNWRYSYWRWSANWCRGCSSPRCTGQCDSGQWRMQNDFA